MTTTVYRVTHTTWCDGSMGNYGHKSESWVTANKFRAESMDAAFSNTSCSRVTVEPIEAFVDYQQKTYKEILTAKPFDKLPEWLDESNSKRAKAIWTNITAGKQVLAADLDFFKQYHEL